jgi:hypothetical protein
MEVENLQHHPLHSIIEGKIVGEFWQLFKIIFLAILFFPTKKRRKFDKIFFFQHIFTKKKPLANIGLKF